MKENKTHYLAPKVSVVAFKVEDGFASIKTTSVTDLNRFGENLNGQYIQRDDLSFGTGGSNTNYGN